MIPPRFLCGYMFCGMHPKNIQNSIIVFCSCSRKFLNFSPLHSWNSCTRIPSYLSGSFKGKSRGRGTRILHDLEEGEHCQVINTDFFVCLVSWSNSLNFITQSHCALNFAHLEYSIVVYWIDIPYYFKIKYCRKPHFFIWTSLQRNHSGWGWGDLLLQ